MYGRIWPVDKSGSRRSISVSSRQHTGLSQMDGHHTRQRSAFHHRSTRPCDKHNIISRFQTREKGAISLPDDAAASIAHHRRPDFFSGRDPHPRHAQTIAPHIRDQGGMYLARAVVIGGAEILVQLDGHRLIWIHPLSLSPAVKDAKFRSIWRIPDSPYAESGMGKTMSVSTYKKKPHNGGLF